MELELTEYGTAQLLEDGKVVWASDADATFKDEFKEEFLTMDDTAEILEFLVDEGHIDDEEADSIEIFEKTLDGAEKEDDAYIDELLYEEDDRE